MVRDVPSTSTSRPSSRARSTARACAPCSATGSCATRCAGSRRRWRSSSWRRSRAPRTPRRVNVPVSEARPADVAQARGRASSCWSPSPPEIPEGELIPVETDWRFGAYAGGDHALAGAARRPRRARRRRRRPPGGRPRRQGAGRRPAPTSPSTPRSPPTCSTPRAAATRSTSWPRSAASRPRPTTCRPSAPCSCTSWPRSQREQLRERGLEPLLHEIELPLVRVLRETREGGAQARHAQARGVGDPHPRRRRAARARDLGHRGRGVHDRLPAAARRGAVRQARPVAQAPRQDRLLAPTRACSQAIRGEHEIIPKIESFRELSKLAQTYLDALPALDRRRRPPAHDVQPGHRRHGPPVLDQPEPPEHPDPHRDRPRDPRLLRPRARQRADLRRLLAGRAARARAHRRRGRPARHLQARRGRPHRDRRRRLRAPAGAAHGRHALEGEDGQLRDRLRPQRLRARRPPPDRAGGGAGVHRPLPASASPPSPSS